MRPAWRSSRRVRIASLSTARSRRPLEQKVCASGLKPGEVDGDVDVAEIAEPLHEGFAPPVRPEPSDLVVRDLDPGQAVVVAHPALAGAEPAHPGFPGCPLGEVVAGGSAGEI